MSSQNIIPIKTENQVAVGIEGKLAGIREILQFMADEPGQESFIFDVLIDTITGILKELRFE